MRKNGGIIGKSNIPTQSIASGVWGLREQLQSKIDDIWPLDFPIQNIILYLDVNNSSSYPGTGTTWTDLSTEGNNGTLTNGPVYNTTYFDFDGDNDYVELGTITTSNPLQLSSPAGGGLSISFAVWFDTGGDGFQRVIDKSNSGVGANGWAIYSNSSTPNAGPLIFQSGDGATLTSTVTPTANTWSIWTFTWNSSTGAWVWYQNGSVVNSATATYSIPSVETNMRIGTWNHTVARELNGRVGFILIHEKALTSTEIQQIFNKYKNTYGL